MGLFFLDFHYSKGLIFWSDYSGGTISRITYPTFNDTTAEVIINTQTPAGLAVDTVNDFLYWVHHNQIISRSNLDGSNTTNLLVANKPIDIELDITNGLLDIATSIPMGITTTNNRVYFSTWSNGQLFVFSKSNTSTKSELIYSSGSSLMSIKVFQSAQSECLNYVELLINEKRSSSYQTDLDVDIPISDAAFEENWYRIISDNGDDMPTYPPGLSYCGTLHPIWINGDGHVACPRDKSSETGYFPGCSFLVKPELVNGPSFAISGYDTTPSLLSVFRCYFDDISNGTYVYDVFWTINGNNVTSKLNVPFKNIDSTLLRDTDWVGLYTMNMEVHSLFTNCGFGWEGSSCHCGIAIRSRNSRFVIRTCKTISRTSKSLLDAPITQLDSCNDNDFLIEHTGNKYKITIPSGTEITITISRWSRFIGSVTIKPSVYDIDRVKGLCGVPSITMDPSDDYTHRKNGPVNDDQDFARSWRITTDMTDEQMFVETPTFISNSYTIDTYSSEYINNAGSTYCACEKQPKSTDSFDEFYTVHCNLTERTEYCPSKSLDNTVNAYQTSCSRSQTTKRSIGSLQSKVSIEDYSASSKDVDYQMTSSQTRMNTVSDIDLHTDDVNKTPTKPQANKIHQISNM
ncbi:LRP4 [Mytilus edulis]|uniref:LRP4 n=1 Tax=Mytilus edulis TaxID=6550 RepID=A0A8S3RRX9_MYTED|nr:LRP4 [Mytilus edulis]